MTLPKQVTLTEVAPRDGLQNELHFVPTKTKIELINQLSETGLQSIETTSFVSMKSIPQLADGADVYRTIKKFKRIQYPVLIPNLHGMQEALNCQVKSIAIFTAASQTFNQRNIHCSIDESIERFKPVVDLAKKNNMFIRAYISCALGCPYEGYIEPEKVLVVVEKLKMLGIDEISFGDTIGVGTPLQTQRLIESVTPIWPTAQTAMHFHDTYGQAIANIYTSLQMGISRFDSSVAGLGGCPYAQGATGNVATEDVLYLMHGLHIETGIDIYKIVQIGDWICQLLKRPNQSKVARALLASYHNTIRREDEC